MITIRNAISRRIALAGLAAAMAIAVPFASAQEQRPQLSEKVSEALQKVRTLEDAKNYQGILDIIDGLLPAIKPGSYDQAWLLDTKARMLVTLNKLEDAIGPWEEALKLSREHHYFSKTNELEITKYIAQLVFEGGMKTKDKTVQLRRFALAGDYLKQYLSESTKPDTNVDILYTQVLYYQAVADPNHVNQHLLAEARKVVEKGMLGDVVPKESLCRLLLAIEQQQNDYFDSARLLEFMVHQFPSKKDFWNTLFGTYANLAGSAKIGALRREYYVRAINTVERAQALGFLQTPRDNLNLVYLYLNAGQFSLGTQMLHEGLTKGTIESNLNNWKVLGGYYQQAEKPLQAIDAFKEATKIFPKEGDFETQIGIIYQQLDRTKDAYEAFKRAVRKGNLGDRPHLVYLYLAYAALELGKYQEALDVVNKAETLPDSKGDTQLTDLKKGIVATIKEQARIKAQAEASTKQQ